MAQDEASKKSHENMLWKLAELLPAAFTGFIPTIVKLFTDELDKLGPKIRREKWDEYCNSLASEGYCDQDTADLLKPENNRPFPFNIISMFTIMLGLPRSQLKTSMEIFSLDTQYDHMQRTTPHPAPVDALLRSAIIDPGRTTENRDQLKKHGFDDTQIDNLFLSMYRTLDENTLRILYMRGLITEERLFERMRELGYTDTRTSELTQTWEVLPGPQDLLHMVAKEAFEPAMYEYLGLFDEFPNDQVEHLEKQGVSRFWAEKYWIAHWDQPSVGQGFEMFQRDVITESELDLLFRAIEMPPFWRDKLTQIAYSPLTRVDVRRMFEMDIMNEQQVFDAYRFHGYNIENADYMTRFTVAYKHSHEKELTRGAILESYNEGLISRSEATALLEEQDYSTDLADYYLDLEDFNRTKDLQKQRITNTRDELLLNQITNSTARTRLNQMGLRGEKIDLYLETWELDRYQYQALPSKSELDNFLLKGIIDRGQWTAVMTRHGYSPQHISWYLDEMQRELEVTRRLPTKADLGNWYKRMVISQVEYFEYMRMHGYSERFIQLYFNALGPQGEQTEE